MDTNQLQAFDMITRQRSFSKAARALDISQPTISMRLQALEQAVGGALFVRGGSRLELTELGRSFLPYARQALAALADGIEIAQQTKQGARGIVSIATLPALTTDFVASAIARFYSDHPRVDLNIHTNHSDQILEMLYDGRVKLGLLNWPLFSRFGLTPILRFREPLIAVAHPSHPLAQERSITSQRMVSEGRPYWRLKWGPDANLWHARLITAGQTVTSIPVHSAHDLVLRGLGVVLLARPLVTADLAAGRLVELAVKDLPSFARESVLVCLSREESRLSTATRTFIAILREEGREFVHPTGSSRT
ncbi:LysR family transcriptional regulator [Ktedonosporobacter rubrisoli]|uniref:LysR family transcriptional regulator n=1 Tax=Ktedonosporobacter rubrisoli TaxID=2509675 RepID=A0A4P6JNG2_KTERU|nr:LysR family transcriptional regulator [Ktedonosporobacter rubrisoli]QBD76640.1 LysR family transcriptional regulator [Ktedonosporobacter rubrisoli]